MVLIKPPPKTRIACVLLSRFSGDFGASFNALKVTGVATTFFRFSMLHFDSCVAFQCHANTSLAYQSLLHASVVEKETPAFRYSNDSFQQTSLISMLAGAVYGYIVATLGESFFHQHIQHGRGWSQLFGPFQTAKMSHETIHHNKTFRKNHVTQFSSEAEQRAVDDYLDDHHSVNGMNSWVRSERYGITLTWLSLVLYCSPFLPFLLPMLYFGGIKSFLISMLPVGGAYWHSKHVHMYMHMPFDQAMQRAGFLMRMYISSKIVRLIWRLHFVHHKYRRGNYNLLIGGDFLRGQIVWPLERDLSEMKALGLPIN